MMCGAMLSVWMQILALVVTQFRAQGDVICTYSERAEEEGNAADWAGYSSLRDPDHCKEYCTSIPSCVAAEYGFRNKECYIYEGPTTLRFNKDKIFMQKKCQEIDGTSTATTAETKEITAKETTTPPTSSYLVEDIVTTETPTTSTHTTTIKVSSSSTSTQPTHSTQLSFLQLAKTTTQQPTSTWRRKLHEMSVTGFVLLWSGSTSKSLRQRTITTTSTPTIRLTTSTLTRTSFQATEIRVSRGDVTSTRTITNATSSTKGVTRSDVISTRTNTNVTPSTTGVTRSDVTSTRPVPHIASTAVARHVPPFWPYYRNGYHLVRKVLPSPVSSNVCPWIKVMLIIKPKQRKRNFKFSFNMYVMLKLRNYICTSKRLQSPSWFSSLFRKYELNQREGKPTLPKKPARKPETRTCSKGRQRRFKSQYNWYRLQLNFSHPFVGQKRCFPRQEFPGPPKILAVSFKDGCRYKPVYIPVVYEERLCSVVTTESLHPELRLPSPIVILTGTVNAKNSELLRNISEAMTPKIIYNFLQLQKKSNLSNTTLAYTSPFIRRIKDPIKISKASVGFDESGTSFVYYFKVRFLMKTKPLNRDYFLINSPEKRIVPGHTLSP